jgi:hypothetical protein
MAARWASKDEWPYRFMLERNEALKPLKATAPVDHFHDAPIAVAKFRT